MKSIFRFGRQKDVPVTTQEPASVASATRNTPGISDLIEEGNRLEDDKKLAAAIELYRRAIELDRSSERAYLNLGIALAGQGNQDEAKSCYWLAINLKPDYPPAHLNLGNLLMEKKMYGEAAAAYREAIRYRPEWAEAWFGLGCALDEIGSKGECIEAYQRALNLDSAHETAAINLAMVYLDLGQGEKSKKVLQDVLDRDSGRMLVLFRLGDIHRVLGEYEEAIPIFRKILVTFPDYLDTYSNLLWTMNFLPDITPEAMLDEHKRFADVVEIKESRLRTCNSVLQHRRLKIGYVSGDFRRHPVSCFIEPLLRHHDRENVEVHCYYNYAKRDEITERFKLLADQWCDIAGLDDEALAQKILADGIDILIDLSGHTGENRLAVFARKPAPLQFTWLGYLSTTGLSAIDYRLCDSHTDPDGVAERWQVEIPARMPDSQWCYQPQTDIPLPSVLPRLTRGYWTFGSLNQISKLNKRVFGIWGKLLHAIPDSRLRVHGVLDPYIAKRILNEFSVLGISSDRLDMVGFVPIEKYFSCYHEVDIALDSFPYNGGTTTCDSLIMGVPVAAIAGNRSVARSGVSLLTTMGLTDWIAPSEEAFVDMVLRHTADPNKLATLRAELPERMRTSPLMDGPRFARNLEAIFRKAWVRWCEQQPSGKH